MYSYNYSVIIPHFTRDGNVEMLRRAVESVPERDDIEIIIVDNSLEPIPNDLFSARKYTKIIYSPNERKAGGARNVGMNESDAKWYVFMDADDLFTPECFSAYDRYVDSDYDIIFSLSQGVYSNDITKLNDRGDIYSDLVMNFLKIGKEKGLRVDYPVPWSKMVRARLVRDNDILFDEVPAGNDVMFGLKIGLAAKKITAIPIKTYMVTTSIGSITRTMSLENLESRLYVKERYNRMLKEHGYKKTASQMYLIVASAKYGIKPFFKFLFTALKDGDLFIGWKHWIVTVFKMHAKSWRKDNATYNINE